MADTILVLLAPGMGDGIQAAKAGILEIGDIFVVNKSDRDGAQALVRELRTMIALAHRGPEGLETPDCHDGRLRESGDWGFAGSHRPVPSITSGDRTCRFTPYCAGPARGREHRACQGSRGVSAEWRRRAGRSRQGGESW